MPHVFQGMWNNGVIGDFLGGDIPAMPAVNVVEKDKEYCVDLSMPGFDSKNVDIEVDRNTLTISAKTESQKEEKGEDDKIIRQEFSSSSFQRSFVLPDNVDTDHIAAKQENGILKITLPKMANAPEDKVKKIAVS